MTTKVVAAEIRPSAHNHGISDDDIRHATTHVIGALTLLAQPEFVMYIGPDIAGRRLEVGVIQADDNDYVLHAMPVRPKYLRRLERPGGGTP